MIKVILPDRVLSVTWEHDLKEGVVLKFGKVFTKAMVTTCFLYELNGTKKLLGGGEAICNPNDRFNPETARKVSLKKAMEQAEIDRSERIKVWASYNASKVGGRWRAVAS